MTQPNFTPVEQEQELNLRDYLQIIYKRRYTALTVFLIIFIVSIILSLGKETPRYTSTSTILLERNFGASNAGLGTSYYWDPEFLPTQTEIIKSKKVARRVVNDLQLDTRYHAHFFESGETTPSFAASIKTSIKTFFSGLFGSESEQNNQQAVPENSAEAEKNIIADIIKAGIEVEPVKDTRVVNIQYTDTNPELAKLIADTLVQAYIEETLEIKLSGTQHSLRWMTAKADQERKKLEESERGLQQYMRENNLVTLENRLAVFPEKLRQFSTDLSIAEAKRREVQDLLDQINKFKDSPDILESLTYFTKNPNLQSLRNQILKAEQRVNELSQKYGPKHPAMIKAIDDRNILLKEKKQEIQRIIDSAKKSYELAKSNEENLRELLNDTKKELLDVNERFVQYSIMKREVDSSRALYEALTSSLKKASVTEESQNVNIWVMREASLPGSPSNQKPQRALLIGFVLAFAGGIGISLLVEYLDNTIKSPEDIENRYGLTVLGTVAQTRKSEQIENIIQENAQSMVAENYRMIRSSLLLSSADHPPRTILITSMKPQAGKSATSINLARTMAQISAKVLIIDADMRKPRLHTLFNVSNDIGLSSFLSGSIDEQILQAPPDKKIIVQVPENENVHIIPSGPMPPNPVELISSQRMKVLLQDMLNNYDYIFIDSPPIINLADGLILSTLVEGTIIVTRAGKTTFEAFNAGMKKISDIKPHILGVILNAVNMSVPGSHSYYYDYLTPHNKDQDTLKPL